MALGSITYTSVTWTTGDIITEVKLDNMVANDQAYDAHAAQGVLLNNNVGYFQKVAGGTNTNIANINASDALAIGANTLTDFTANGRHIFWHEIGRTTLGSAGDTVTVSSLPARKYLMLLVSLIDTGGTIAAAITFNSDTGTNYARRAAANGAADATVTSGTGFRLDAGTLAGRIWAVATIINIAGQEKMVIANCMNFGASGAGTAPSRTEEFAKWTNTANQISTVTVTNTGTGDFNTGSEVVVLGHD